jgi:hypothetical protein
LVGSGGWPGNGFNALVSYDFRTGGDGGGAGYAVLGDVGVIVVNMGSVAGKVGR